MRKYFAIVHHEDDKSYGVWFPDLPGCYGAGDTEDEALAAAKKSLLLFAEDAEDDGEALREPRTLSELMTDSEVRASLSESNGFLVSVPLILNTGRTKRVSLDLDVSLIEWIDQLRTENNLTRKAWFEQIARNCVFAYFAGIENGNNCVRLKRRKTNQESFAA